MPAPPSLPPRTASSGDLYLFALSFPTFSSAGALARPARLFLSRWPRTGHLLPVVRFELFRSRWPPSALSLVRAAVLRGRECGAGAEELSSPEMIRGASRRVDLVPRCTGAVYCSGLPPLLGPAQGSGNTLARRLPPSPSRTVCRRELCVLEPGAHYTPR